MQVWRYKFSKVQVPELLIPLAGGTQNVDPILRPRLQTLVACQFPDCVCKETTWVYRGLKHLSVSCICLLEDHQIMLGIIELCWEKFPTYMWFGQNGFCSDFHLTRAGQQRPQCLSTTFTLTPPLPFASMCNYLKINWLETKTLLNNSRIKRKNQNKLQITWS